MNRSNISTTFRDLQISRTATTFGATTVVIVAVGLVGSTVFLYVLWKEQKQRPSVKAAFISLCLSTLSFCIFAGSFQALTFLTQGRNFLADPRYSFLCRLNAFLNTSTNFVVVMCHAVIAVNRFLVMFFYDKPALLNSKWLLGFLLAAPWVISGVVYIFPFFGLGATYAYEPSPIFKCTFTKRLAVYFIASRTVTTCLALLLIFVSYSAIWIKVNTNESLRNLSRGQNKVTGGERGQNGQTLAGRDLKQTKRDLRVSRITFVTFMAFAVCFLPSTIQAYMRPASGDLVWVTVQSLNHLQWIGCAISPWLPVLLTSNWRNMMFQKWTRKSTNGQQSATEERASIKAVKRRISMVTSSERLPAISAGEASGAL